MKLIIALSALIALSRAGQIYQGTTQSTDEHDQQTAEINHLGNLQQNGYQQDQYQPNNYYQTNSILNNARILNYQSDKSDYGYQYAYETDNGIRAEEVGQNQGNGHVVQGAYSYTGDDGQVYTVTYTADENGFHPQGAHLPTPPPTPEAILKSLEKNALDEANGIFDDGSYKENPHQYETQQQSQDPLQQQYSQSQNQYSQSQNQYSQGQNQYSQSQNQYSHGLNQFSQSQPQVSQSQTQLIHSQQYQQLQAPRYQSFSSGQYQTTGLAAKYQPSAPAIKLPATGTANYNSGGQFQGYQISAPSGSGHY